MNLTIGILPMSFLRFNALSTDVIKTPGADIMNFVFLHKKPVAIVIALPTTLVTGDMALKNIFFVVANISVVNPLTAFHLSARN